MECNIDADVNLFNFRDSQSVLVLVYKVLTFNEHVSVCYSLAFTESFPGQFLFMHIFSGCICFLCFSKSERTIVEGTEAKHSNCDSHSIYEL